MKTSLATLALVAVASSLATVGALELLRDSRAVAEIEPPAEPGADVARRAAEPLVPPPRVQEPPPDSTQHDDRLVELERRIAALETRWTSRRVPVGSAAGEPPPRDELRALVLDWVAEEREARGRSADLAEEEEWRRERAFEARFSAYMLAQEHELADWQQEKLAQVFLEIEVRRDELDVETMQDEPEVAEARWDEFDQWAEQRLVEEMGQEVIDLIEGEDE